MKLAPSLQLQTSSAVDRCPEAEDTILNLSFSHTEEAVLDICHRANDAALEHNPSVAVGTNLGTYETYIVQYMYRLSCSGPWVCNVSPC